MWHPIATYGGKKSRFADLKNISVYVNCNIRCYRDETSRFSDLKDIDGGKLSIMVKLKFDQNKKL